MLEKLKFAMFGAALAVSAASQAAVITTGSYIGTDVGQLDELIATTSVLPNSSPSSELNWVNALLGTGTATTYVKEESVAYWATDLPNVYAFLLSGDPGYYVIKNSKFWALLQNNESTDWGVFSTALLPDGLKLGGSGNLTISHVTAINPRVSVPEPATLGLLGLGLLGVSVVRLRRHSRYR